MRPFDPAVLRALPEARRPLARLALIGLAQGAATIATAFALSAVVVAVVEGGPLAVPATFLGAVFVARSLLGLAGERVAAAAGTIVSSALRGRLLARWLSVTADDRPDPAEGVTLTTQGAASTEPYVARYLPALVSAAVVPACTIIVLGLVDWLSAVVVVLTLPLLPVFAALIGASTRDATARRWGALADLSGHFLDVVRGVPTLVAYGRGERQVGTVRAASQAHRRATMATLRLAFLSSAALELLATICVGIVAVVVGLRLTHGSIDLGTGLVAILLAPEAYWPIRRVGAEFHSAADGAAALGAALSHLESVGPRPRGRVERAVVARGLAYTHPGSTDPVIDGLDLDAGVGLSVVTGPSGCGKSTLLELLAGLRTPSAGTVAAAPSHLVSQRPFLAAAAIRDNLTMGAGREVTDDAIWAALREVELDGVVAAQPRGLDTRVGDDGWGLSAGQRARLTLARAGLSSAGVLLLDEPTAHLDDRSETLVHHVIQRLASSRCVVAVTHRAELLALADQVVVLDARPAPAPMGAVA